MSDSNWSVQTEVIGTGLAVLASVILCCTIVAVVTFATVSYTTDRDDRAEYYQAEAQRNAEVICVGKQGGLLPECVEEQRRASRDAYTAEQDLNAQRQMALWALWMFIVSAITAGLTLWALWYVRGTLQATREALQDTGDATKAMIAQNSLTERVQRPWVSVSVKPRLLRRAGAAFRVEMDIEYKNLGQLPAKNFQLNRVFYWTAETNGSPDDPFARLHPMPGPNRKTIMPSDTEIFRDWSYQLVEGIPDGGDSVRQGVIPILLISVFYKSDVTGDEWLRTDKAYFVARWVEDRRLSAVYPRDFDQRLSGADLHMEQITSATLAD